MAKVTVRPTSTSYKAIGQLMRSAELGAQLFEIAKPIYDEAKRDPNERYASTLRIELRNVGKRRGRAKVRISTLPVLGARVEAKRGTLARAVGKAGL